MQTKEFELEADEQPVKYVNIRRDLFDSFPTRQQRRAEERRRAKESVKKKIQPTRNYR